jgi:hypothetical protein
VLRIATGGRRFLAAWSLLAAELTQMLIHLSSEKKKDTNISVV